MAVISLRFGAIMVGGIATSSEQSLDHTGSPELLLGRDDGPLIVFGKGRTA